MSTFGHTYIRLIMASLGAALLILAIGYYPTLRCAGPAGIRSMLAGIAVSLVAGCVGAIPIGLAGDADPAKRAQSILGATAIRFVMALALTLIVIFAGWTQRGVFVVWVGIAYLTMLAIDTFYAVHVVGRQREKQP